MAPWRQGFFWFLVANWLHSSFGSLGSWLHWLPGSLASLGSLAHWFPWLPASLGSMAPWLPGIPGSPPSVHGLLRASQPKFNRVREAVRSLPPCRPRILVRAALSCAGTGANAVRARPWPKISRPGSESSEQRDTFGSGPMSKQGDCQMNPGMFKQCQHISSHTSTHSKRADFPRERRQGLISCPALCHKRQPDSALGENTAKHTCRGR